jgi:pilus assembly protein CpaD
MVCAVHQTGWRTIVGQAAFKKAAVMAARMIGVASVAAGLAGCFQTGASDMAQADDYPADYRLRHPISINERDRTIDIFTGSNRGGLTPTQRAEVLSFAQSWKREGTGGIIIAAPSGSPNERAASESLYEMRSIFAAAGIPEQAVGVRGYRATGGTIAPLKISYPKVKAEAGPCGLWPENLGPSFDASWQDNKPYWNLGCATQHNMAAMVENPEDLVQPRAETPASASRRNVVLDKYRRGEATATTYPNADKGKISEVGK